MRLVQCRRAFIPAFAVTVVLTAAAGAAGGSPVGTMKHPVPLGRTAAVSGGWLLQIRSVDWDAATAIHAVPGQYARKPSAAVRQVLLTVAISYRGGINADIAVDFADRVYVIAVDKLPWGWDSIVNECGPGQAKLPPPDIQPRVEKPGMRVVPSGTTITGHMCFEVPTSDVRRLRLYVKSIPKAAATTKPVPLVWFALR